MLHKQNRRIHFVGIGGIGMSGIAELLINLGHTISGSDLKESDITNRLQELGATIKIGHAAQHLQQADVVVYSSAVRQNNPELLAAQELNVPIIPRAEMLAELMRLKFGVAIAGTHGKTTITSLAGTILKEANLDPTIIVGGQVKALGTNAVLGKSEYLIAEADESDGSFLTLMPSIAVISNIDPEHLDHWSGGIDELKQAFIDFANKTPFYGKVILCIDHPVVQSCIPAIKKTITTYGLSAQADYMATDISWQKGYMQYQLITKGKPQGIIKLNMLGEHNILNSLAAIAVAQEFKVPSETISNALAHFKGIGRRLELKGQVNQIKVYDDYAHHPIEIKATLKAMRKAFNNRIIVGFQPHRYTRTRDFYNDFLTAFNEADAIYISDIYAASEDPIDQISSEILARDIKQLGHKDVHYCGELHQLAQNVVETLQAGDVFVTIGAGNIWTVGTDVLNQLSHKSQTNGEDHG